MLNLAVQAARGCSAKWCASCPKRVSWEEGVVRRGCRAKRVSCEEGVVRGGCCQGPRKWCCREVVSPGGKRGCRQEQVSTGDIELVLSQMGVRRRREEGVARSGCRQGKGKGSVSRDPRGCCERWCRQGTTRRCQHKVESPGEGGVACSLDASVARRLCLQGMRRGCCQDVAKIGCCQGLKGGRRHQKSGFSRGR